MKASNSLWRDRIAAEIEPGLASEIDAFESEIALKKQGKIDDKIFAETRRRRGAYGQRYDNGQRHDGIESRKLAFPHEGLTKGPNTLWDAPGMQRIKHPFGGMNAAQLEVMAELAEEYSDGIAHVTTRQDFQLHYVHIEDAPSLMRRLAAVGITTREACGNALVRIGAVDSRLVAMDGDTKNSTFSEKFSKRFSDRFSECFIAEQCMVGVATGFSTRGKVPFASTFACFLTRAYDQIRVAGISTANIKLVGSHVGVSIGEDGPSQMGLEDIAMMRAVAGSTVVYASDAVCAEKLMDQIAAHKGICFLRTSRPKTPVIYSNEETFPIGGAKVLRQSAEDKVTVVAAGVTLYEALKAADALKSEGIGITVIDAYSIKPLAKDVIKTAAKKTKNLVVTVEDHYIEGGLGDAVAGELSADGVKVHKLAVQELPHSGHAAELLAKYHIDANAIINKVKALA